MQRRKITAGVTAAAMLLAGMAGSGLSTVTAADGFGGMTWITTEEDGKYQTSTTGVENGADAITVSFENAGDGSPDSTDPAGFCAKAGGADWSGYGTLKFTVQNSGEQDVVFATAIGTGDQWTWHQSGNSTIAAGTSKEITLYLQTPEWSVDGEACAIADLYMVQRVNMMVMAPDSTTKVSGSVTLSDWKFGTAGGVVPVEPKDGFYVSGNTLYDANQTPFIMRGTNYAYTWYKWEAKDDPAQTLAEIAGYGANTVRIVLSNGAQYTKDTTGAVKNLIALCEQNKLVAVLEVHDATGKDDAASLKACADYFAEIKDALIGHEDTVIINIANEWQGNANASAWKAAYLEAVSVIREAGLTHCILCDAGGWGQGWRTITDDNAGEAVLKADPEQNILFAVHMYGTAGGSATTIKQVIDSIRARNLCLCIGEFGYKHSDGDVDEAYIMEYCQAQSVGWLSWSWYGNGSPVEYLDMSSANVGGTLSPEWGEVVVNGAYGWKKTAEICSVYESAPIGTTTTTTTTSTETTTTTVTVIVPTMIGDFNCDGKISIADVVLLARYVAEDAELQNVTEQGIANADCNGDEKINSGDITEVCRYLAHLITTFG